MRFGTTKEGLEEMLRRAPTNNDKAVIDFFTNQFELACFEENSAGDRFIRVICDYGQVSTKNGQPIPGPTEYKQRADKFDVYLYEDGTSRVTKSSY